MEKSKETYYPKSDIRLLQECTAFPAIFKPVLLTDIENAAHLPFFRGLLVSRSGNIFELTRLMHYKYETLPKCGSL